MDEAERSQIGGLREYLTVLRARKWTIILVTLLVIGSAIGFSYLQTPQYTAEARVLVEPLPTNQATAAVTTVYPPPVNLETEREIVDSAPVAALARDALDSDGSTDDLLRNLSVEGILETEVLIISFVSANAEFARDAANAFAEGYLDYRKNQARSSYQAERNRLERTIENTNEQIAGLTEERAEAAGALDDFRVATIDSQLNLAYGNLVNLQNQLGAIQPLGADAGQVIEPAETPGSPSSPSYFRNGALGAFLGLALGVGLAFFRERLDDRFRGRTDVERALEVPVLATVPRFSGKGNAHQLVVMTQPQSAAAEAYRSLRTNLQFVVEQQNVKSLLVTSPSAGEGKTVTTANLGVALAQTGRRITLVSADLRRPTLERYFNVNNRHGLSTFLLSPEKELWQVAQDPGVPNIRILACGPVPGNPSELLTSPRLPELMEELERDCDVVIFDAPPALAVADASILASQVGGSLLVINADDTHRSAALRAHQELERVGGNVVGSVLNAFDPSGSPYYRYEPYRYGYKSDPEFPKVGNGETAGEKRRRSLLGFRR